MGIRKNTLNEIEQEMISYLLNVDDLNYSMLCEPLVMRYKSGMTPDISDIVGIEKISLINRLIGNDESLESMELIDTQNQIEFPKRKFHPLRPATLEDELAEDPSYSE